MAEGRATTISKPGAQDAHLVVDPSGSDDGLDDVQDLHEKRLVPGAIVDERNKNNTAKGCVVQSAKM